MAASAKVIPCEILPVYFQIDMMAVPKVIKREFAIVSISRDVTSLVVVIDIGSIFLDGAAKINMLTLGIIIYGRARFPGDYSPRDVRNSSTWIRLGIPAKKASRTAAKAAAVPLGKRPPFR